MIPNDGPTPYFSSLLQPSERALIVLHVLGQCLIRTAVTSVTPRADMCFALASYLTRERGRRFPRRTIEKFFWPGIRSGDASHSLSGLLHKLRDRGFTIHRDDASCIWLPRDAATMDVESLATEPLAHLAERDLAVLPGYCPRTSANYSDWVDEWRDELQSRVLREVVAATSRAANSRDWELTIALARQALTIDPTNVRALSARAGAAAQLARANTATMEVSTRLQPDEHSIAHVRECVAFSEWPARRLLGTATRDTQLVGRADQMRRLREQAMRVLHGEVCSSYLSAPAGIGKSRLVREITAVLRSSGAATCSVSCERHDVHGPLSAFIQAVPRLQSLPGAAGCAPATFACLARITQLNNDEPAMTASDNSLHVSGSIRAAIVDLIDAVADEQPLLLVIEDVHWIDQASWALLRTIAASAQRSVFLICTSRVPWKHSEWGPSDYFSLEELPALDAIAARLHVCNYLERVDRRAADAYVTWCAETANGNPYFIEELVNYWVSTGEQFSAPPSLVSLTTARLSRLQPDALRVIQAAAILGKNSTVELLQQVLELPTHTLISSIEELAQADLLTVQNADSNATVPALCRHDLIIRAATRGLSPQGRALLHHAAARAMESSSAASSHSAEALWDCAYHWNLAGQPERSIRAAVACAHHLHNMGLVDDAVRTCEATLAMVTTDAGKAAVLRVMAESQYAARHWSEFCKTAAEVRRLENASGTPSPLHDDLELCELNAQRNLHRDWDRALESALKCVGSFGADTTHRVKASITALKIATNVGQLELMDTIYHNASQLAQSEAVSIVDRLTLAMVFHAIRGDPVVGAEVARELLDIAERTLPERHRFGIMIDCAGALRRGSDTEEAAEVYTTIFHSAVKLNCFDVVSEACHRLIEMHCDEGRMDRAEQCANSYRSLRRPAAELRADRNLRLAIAKVYVWREQWEAATALLEKPKSKLPWQDRVAMFRSGALAIKLRLDIGRSVPHASIARLVENLSTLSFRLRRTGAQDYECYSLYLGYVYLGDAGRGEAFLRTYVEKERRDTRPIAPEIADELRRLAAKPATPIGVSELPGCAVETDEPCA
ncbi:MAG: ATP-binding protein [Gemmatimonadaceae bacterium]